MGTLMLAATDTVEVAHAGATLVAAFFAGRNERTLRAYREDLEQFRAFLGVESVEQAALVLLTGSPGDANLRVLSWRASMVERGLQPATINRRLAAVRSLTKLARTLGMISWAVEVENVRAQAYRDTRGPGRGGFRALLEEAGRQPERKAKRDRALLRLLYDLALRRSEVVGLDLADVDLSAGTVAVLGKGRAQKERLTLPAPTRGALEAWIAVRGTEPGPLFPNLDRAHKRERLTGTGLYLLIRELGRRAGLRVRPHGLRHAGITEALDVTNGNVRAVQRYSRHRDVRVVAIYDDNRLDLGGDVARLVAMQV